MKQLALIVPVLATAWALIGAPEKRQDSGESELAPVQTAANFDAQLQARALRSSDLDERRKAYDRILAWSAQNPAVAEAIESWRSGDDLELAWSAELLLRERNQLQERRPAPGRWLGGMGPSPFDRQHQLLLDLQDLFQSPLDSWLDPSMQGQPSWPTQRQPQWGPGGGTQRSSSEAFRIESGPDGVKVEWTEMVDGEETQRSYTAKSMEELLEAHPELKQKLSLNTGSPLSPMDPWSSLRRQMNSFGRPGLGAPWSAPWSTPGRAPWGNAQPMRTDVLGVRVLDPSQRTEAIPGVDDNHGLRILSVVPHSLAQRLGLRAGETILYINDTKIESVADVQSALRMRTSEEPLRVDVCDEAGEQRSREWSPEPNQLKVH